VLLVSASSAEVIDVAKQAGCRVESYGVNTRAAPGVTPFWHATIEENRADTGRTVFSVTRAGEDHGRFDVGMSGEYNIENALAVVAAASSLGLSVDAIARAFRRFRGVKRRQEIRGIAAGVTVIDDYGHHPTAVRETLAALRRRAGRGKLLAIYEPRSATSRRATFQKEFAEAFAGADEVVIAKLWAPEGIPAAQRFDPERMAADLRSRGTAARMIPEVSAIVDDIAARATPGDGHEKILHKLGDPILPAKPEDMPRVREILEKAGLLYKDLTDDRAGEVLVVADETGIIGCVAVEIHDEGATLRSLAVLSERRGRGLGWMLADAATQRARQCGAKRLYLLTEHATDFFAEKLGFRAVDRVMIDPEVAVSMHFRESAKSAIAMRLDLG
jgi:UDP-N-acetylmuramate: L-alanyl-gamma-D-glutamyl-meso-diaminopimelate ligase